METAWVTGRIGDREVKFVAGSDLVGIDGVTLEFEDPHLDLDGENVVAPVVLRINGIPVHTSVSHPIEIDPITLGEDLVAVTVTLLAKTVHIGGPKGIDS